MLVVNTQPCGEILQKYPGTYWPQYERLADLPYYLLLSFLCYITIYYVLVFFSDCVKDLQLDISLFKTSVISLYQSPEIG